MRTLIFALPILLIACQERRAAFEPCAADDDCLSNFCYGAECLAPDGDVDDDGLSNYDEYRVGTDARDPDSDGDGASDGAEVGDPANPSDADGDATEINGAHDANESAIADADNDCIPDQLDPHTDAFDSPEAAAAILCLRAGVCGAPGASVVGVCKPVITSGVTRYVFACDYTGVPGFQADEANCDGADNDCDGFTDEGAFYVDGDGWDAAVGAECNGLGGCSAMTGVVECLADSEGVAGCSVNAGGSAYQVTAVDDNCDGVDDDCDGVTDGAVPWVHPVSGDVFQVGAACTAPGRCAATAGLVECVVGAVPTARCSTGAGGSATLATTEDCNGVDDDCDGTPDDGLTVALPDGGTAEIGDPCGLGVCAGGAVVCEADGALCSTADLATDGYESCNLADDDCDGETDEADGIAQGCPMEGICGDLEPTLITCVSSPSCLDEGKPESECLVRVCGFDEGEGYEAGIESSCDGIDNNCDGQTDEGCR